MKVKDAHPLPRIDSCMDRLRNSYYYTTIDMCVSFWQVPLKVEDRPKTAFSFDGQLWQWTVMPFRNV